MYQRTQGSEERENWYSVHSIETVFQYYRKHLRTDLINLAGFTIGSCDVHDYVNAKEGNCHFCISELLSQSTTGA